MSDFFDMLKEHNINIDDLNRYINSRRFEMKAGPVVDDKNKNYIVKESSIEGLGVFATRANSKGRTHWIWNNKQDKNFSR